MNENSDKVAKRLRTDTININVFTNVLNSLFLAKSHNIKELKVMLNNAITTHIPEIDLSILHEIGDVMPSY